MGGNALKTVQTTRKSPEDYEKIKDYVLRTLCTKLADSGIQWSVPYEAPGKESFGDLDVLLTRQSGFDSREWILETFKPDELVSNGGVYSFNIGNEEGQHIARDFQIDFITTSPETFAVHHFFLSWGDCGMLVGQIAHAAGLRFGADESASPNANCFTVRFGQQGLFVGYSTNPGMSDDLILSRDPRQICRFLGLDFDRWYNRFETEPEIFAWLCQSPYLHKIKFDRSRRCREMYLRFGEFVKSGLAPTQDPIPQPPTFDEIIAHFGKESELAAIQKKQTDVKRRSDKFHAGLFAELGLTGKALGQTIARFKQSIPGDFQAWVLDTDLEEIQRQVSRFIQDSAAVPTTCD